jgi:hypothetical protein
VAWVTTLGPDMGQIDYRLREDAGCSLNPGRDQQQHEQAQDRQVDYRLAGDRPLEWIGDGLRAVGIEPGTAMDEAARDAARMLARGRDPREPDHTKKGVLVTPKKAVDPRAKLAARPLVDAIRAAAAAGGTGVEAFLAARGDARVVARFGRLQRGVAREAATAAPRARRTWCTGRRSRTWRAWPRLPASTWPRCTTGSSWRSRSSTPARG